MHAVWVGVIVITPDFWIGPGISPGWPPHRNPILFLGRKNKKTAFLVGYKSFKSFWNHHPYSFSLLTLPKSPPTWARTMILFAFCQDQIVRVRRVGGTKSKARKETSLKVLLIFYLFHHGFQMKGILSLWICCFFGILGPQVKHVVEGLPWKKSWRSTQRKGLFG